ncbi:PGG domain, partial [Arabidopsis thaliana x Arabidopsis arenosa]
VKIGQDSLKPARCSSLHQLAYPYRFNFTAKNSLEKAEIERRRKGKQVVVADDGERTDTGIEVVNGREIGETSNAAAIRGRTGEQIIDIASLTGQNREDLCKTDQQMQTDAVYKEALLSARNIVALVVIFLATVGCTTGLNPPGGLNNDGKEIAFFIFMLAVYTMVPVCIITLGLLCGVTPRSQKVQRNTLKLCHTFMWVGLIAFAVVFVSGSWLIVPSDRLWLKLIGALATLAGMIVIISFIWSKKARKQLRRFSFCELDGSSDDDEQAAPMVTTNIPK